MSMQLLSRERWQPEAQPTSTPDNANSRAITLAILRATGVILLMSLAVIHIVQLVPTFQQTPLLGVAYVFLIAAALVVGARLIKGHSSVLQLWLPVAGLGAAVFLGYSFTRMLSTPLDNQDVGNWACTLGMASLFVEGLMVAVATYAVSIRRTVSPEPLGVDNRIRQEP